MIEIIEQNFSIVQIFQLGPNSFFWPDQYFQLMTSLILNPEIQYKTQSQRKCYFSFILRMSLTKLRPLLVSVHKIHFFIQFSVIVSAHRNVDSHH